MIAVFWDDMKTSQGGDVFYKSFPDGCQLDDCDYMVVEWSDMRTQVSNSDEDFQIVFIMERTPTGDSEFKCNIKLNNTSDGYYPEGGKTDIVHMQLWVLKTNLVIKVYNIHLIMNILLVLLD